MATVALGSAVVLNAMLAQGRISSLITPGGLLILAWLTVSALLFGALGQATHRAGIWISPRE